MYVSESGLSSESGSFTANFNVAAGGGSSANTSKTVYYTKIGNQVTLKFPDCSNMTAGANLTAFGTASNTLPVALRPAIIQSFPVTMKINNALQSNCGVCNVYSTGEIYIYRDIPTTGAFSSGVANNGPLAFSITYMTS